MIVTFKWFSVAEQVWKSQYNSTNAKERWFLWPRCWQKGWNMTFMTINSMYQKYHSSFCMTYFYSQKLWIYYVKLLSQRVSPLKFSAAELVFSLECLLHAKSYFICRRAKSCYAWGNKMFTPLYTFAKASLYNFVCTAQLLSVSQQLQRNASETLGKIYISVRAKKSFCT